MGKGWVQPAQLVVGRSFGFAHGLLLLSLTSQAARARLGIWALEIGCRVGALVVVGPNFAYLAGPAEEFDSRISKHEWWCLWST